MANYQSWRSVIPEKKLDVTENFSKLLLPMQTFSGDQDNDSA
jgi:hypothetical protein